MLLEALQRYYESGWSYYGIPELLNGLWSMNEIELYMSEYDYPKRSDLVEFSSILKRIKQQISKMKKLQEVSDPQDITKLPKPILKHYLKMKENQYQKERRFLENILKYYKDKGEHPDSYLSTNEELSVDELNSFMRERGYPLNENTTDQLTLQQRILKEMAQIEQYQLNYGFKTKQTLTGILVIHSWSKLIGSEFKGFFKKAPVRSIERDSIAMVVDLGRGFQEVTGEDLYLITGPGIYFTEFKLETELLVRDYREITGIILPRAIYQSIRQSKPIYQSEKIRAAITELAAFIPFNIVLYSYSTQAYLRGVLTRSVFAPHKHMLNLLSKNCNDKNAYATNEGLKVLSASSIYFNRLLVESKFLNFSNSNEFIELTAGLADIRPGLENILHELFPPTEIEQVLERINSLKESYADYGDLLLHNWSPE